MPVKAPIQSNNYCNHLKSIFRVTQPLNNEIEQLRQEYASIRIGAYNRLRNECKIMKITQIPDYCIVKGGTIIYDTMKVLAYSVIGNGNNIVVKTTGLDEY